MAYYAELKRRNWYRINGMRNMIYVYSEMLYDEWYDSLSDEDKQYLEEQKKKRREKEDAELRMLMQQLGMMSTMVRNLYKYDETNEKKYHGVYDERGFPQI